MEIFDFHDKKPDKTHYWIFKDKNDVERFYKTGMDEYFRYIALYGSNINIKWTYNPPEGSKIYG